MTNSTGDTTAHPAELQPEPAPPSLWRNRDFVLLWSGQAVSTLGTRVSGLALPFLVLALTHSPAQAGLIGAAQALPYLIFSLPAGALIDRWDRKAVMIRCDVIRSLAFGSVPLAATLGHVTLAQLYVVAVVAGTALVFFDIAEVSCLPRVAPASQLPRANGLNATAEATALVAGPSVSGVIISLARTQSAGAVLAYLVDSLSYLASVVSLLFIRIPFQAERAPSGRRSLRADIAEGVRFLWAHHQLRVLALSILSTNLLLTPLSLVVIVLGQKHLHLTAWDIGLIIGVAGVGALAGSALAPWIVARVRTGQLIIGGVLLWALGAAIIAVAVSGAMVLGGELLINVLTPVVNVAGLSYRLGLIPDALQGRVNSAYRLAAFGGIPIGTAGEGALLGYVDPRTVLWIIVVGLVLTALAVSATNVRRA